MWDSSHAFPMKSPEVQTVCSRQGRVGCLQDIGFESGFDEDETRVVADTEIVP